MFLASARYTFSSGSADNIKEWMFPDGKFIQNLSGHNAIINTLAVNSDGVLVSGGIGPARSFGAESPRREVRPHAHLSCLVSASS